MKEKIVFRIVLFISFLVFAVVVILNRKWITPPDNYPSFINSLPFLNACINGTCAILLMISFWSIKNKKVKLHKQLNLWAFFLSSMFLISYVIYHFFVPETHFGGAGFIRYFYYFVLITHIVFAAIVLPLVLLSFYYGLQNDVYKHKKWVRFSYPIWVYVTISGVLVYLLISPYYPR